jgi:hypothetical protein
MACICYCLIRKREPPEKKEEETETEDDIKKMTVSQLRNLVTTRGLSNDVHKLKRQELIRILTSNKSTSTIASLQDLAFVL